MSVQEEAVTATEHNFDRPIADDAGNIHAAMCSRCGKTTELDGGDIPDAIKNEECEHYTFELQTNYAFVVGDKFGLHSKCPGAGISIGHDFKTPVGKRV